MEYSSIIYSCINSIDSIINLIVFILFSVYYHKGKINDFRDFSKCNFFTQSYFEESFNYIFIVYDNCKKVFFINIANLIFNYCISFIFIIIAQND